jgi:hypothetical protein
MGLVVPTSGSVKSRGDDVGRLRGYVLWCDGYPLLGTMVTSVRIIIRLVWN